MALGLRSLPLESAGVTMQQRPNNPIQQRKDQVRKHSRASVAYVAGGVIGGLVIGFIFSPSWLFYLLGLIVAVVGGGYNALKVRAIVNHRDDE